MSRRVRAMARTFGSCDWAWCLSEGDGDGVRLGLWSIRSGVRSVLVMASVTVSVTPVVRAEGFPAGGAGRIVEDVEAGGVVNAMGVVDNLRDRE